MSAFTDAVRDVSNMRGHVAGGGLPGGESYVGDAKWFYYFGPGGGVRIKSADDICKEYGSMTAAQVRAIRQEIRSMLIAQATRNIEVVV